MENKWIELVSYYSEIRDRVRERLLEFDNLKKRGDEGELFEELAFCLMTPQTKARQAEKAINLLKKDNLLYLGSEQELSLKLGIVRFRHHKARYICEARSLFFNEGKSLLKSVLDSSSSSIEKREWLVLNIKGFGYKEASHFLRNTGYESSFAILDRHVVRNLISLGVLQRDKKSLTRNTYLAVEKEMTAFSKRIGISMDYLDFVFIYMDTGDIFK